MTEEQELEFEAKDEYDFSKARPIRMQNGRTGRLMLLSLSMSWRSIKK